MGAERTVLRGRPRPDSYAARCRDTLPTDHALEKGGQRAASATLAAFEEVLFATDEAMVVACYRAAMRACALTPEVVGPVLKGRRMWERARALLDDLHRRRGITPTIECMNALLSALESGGQFERIEPTVGEMKGVHDLTSAACVLEP